MKYPFEIKVGLKTCISICRQPFSDCLPVSLQMGIARLSKDAYDYIEKLEKERDALKRDLCTSCPACKHFEKCSCALKRSIPYGCEPCDGYEWRGEVHDNQ